MTLSLPQEAQPRDPMSGFSGLKPGVHVTLDKVRGWWQKSSELTHNFSLRLPPSEKVTTDSEI